MLIYLFYERSFDGVVFSDDINDAVGLAESDRAITLPPTTQCVISKSWDNACRFQTFFANKIGPECELAQDLWGNFAELLSSRLGQLDFHFNSVPLLGVQSRRGSGLDLMRKKAQRAPMTWKNLSKVWSKLQFR
jgi:hypothetical protein